MLKVILPATITDAMFVSSTLAADPDTWASGTTYALNDTVVYKHRNCQSLQAANTNHAPDELNSTWWLDIGPTNRWAMFDNRTSTASSATGCATTPMSARVAPGLCGAVAVLGVTGAASVRVQQYNGATLVYDHTQTLDNTYIADWFAYFFEEFDTKTDVYFDGLLPYMNGQIVLTITGTNDAMPTTCSGFHCGVVGEIGQVQYGATAGIIDYSVKETDGWGTTTLVQRDYAKRTTYPLVIDRAKLRYVYSALASLRATPAVWIGAETYDLSPLVVYGFYKDFSVNVAYPDHVTASIEIEGMT